MDFDKKPGSNTRTALSLLATAGISAGVAFAAAYFLPKPRKPVELRGKIALITGSRGLGLAIAEELGAGGARIALCARNPDELNSACEILARQRIEAVSFPADISDPSQIEPLVNRVLDHFGRIDILVNNAGEIRVGPFENFDRSDFEHAMNLMFWAAVNLTFAVLPSMKRHGGGHIINITSVGGRISVPHLLPYSCAKFALVGFSTGMSTELRPQGVHVLTVIPGLMRTGSYLKAQFKGYASHEFAWFGLLGNLPGFSVAASYAARAIRNALERDRRICTISFPAKFLIACDAMIPETTRRILELVNRIVLPGPNDSAELREGMALSPQLGKTFQALTALGRQAALELNEQ